MKPIAMSTLLVLCTAFAVPSTHAQSVAVPDAAPTNSLYFALGQKPGIDKLASDFVQGLLDDARMRPFFERANLSRLKGQLADQFCMLSGGPCMYKGADMKSAHSNLDITKADFNALVEVLQNTMDANGIAFADQNRLLAKLAPIHRDAITQP